MASETKPPHNGERAKGFRKLPKSAFVEGTLPILRDGKFLFYRAPSLNWKYSRELSDRKDEKLKIKEPGNFQVVMVAPPKRANDFSVDLYMNLLDQPMGRYPVAEYKESPFGKDKETRLDIIGEGTPETVFIVASAIEDADYKLINDVASRYKKMPGVKKVVLVSPFMANEREDKNAKLNEQTGEVEYTGQTIKVAGVMEMLSKNIDKIINFEPHSSASQTWAAENGMPLAPISLWKLMADEFKGELEVRDEDFNPNEYAFIRPDKGRNIAALRIKDYLGIYNKINFEKDRDSNGDAKFKDLTPEQIDQIRDKNLLLYDDEGATFGTMKGVIEKIVQAKAGVKSINVLLGHARFADGFYDKVGKYHKGWRENIDLIINMAEEAGIKIKFLVSDSRQALGDANSIDPNKNIYAYAKAHEGLFRFVSVVPLIREVIEAEVNGVNFWKNKNGLKELLIQALPGDEDEEEF
jgi:phosphoribosylpyrophosphate synthetase